MIILKGYKLNSTDQNELNEVIKQMQDICLNKAQVKYHELLSKEIESIVDDISRNIIPRPEDRSILDCANSILEDKIVFAITNNLPVPYNFSICANIFLYEDSLYLRFETGNDLYTNAFGRIKNLIPFSVSEEAIDSMGENNNKAKIWENIRQKYFEDGINPLFIRLTPFGRLDIDKDMLKFQNAKQRIRTIARREALGKFFNMLSGGQQAPPNRAMEYIEDAIEMLQTSMGKEELKERTRRLHGVIQNITYEMISFNPLDKIDIQAEEESDGEVDSDVTDEKVLDELQKEYFKSLQIPEEQEKSIEKIGNNVDYIIS